MTLNLPAVDGKKRQLYHIITSESSLLAYIVDTSDRDILRRDQVVIREILNLEEYKNLTVGIFVKETSERTMQRIHMWIRGDDILNPKRWKVAHSSEQLENLIKAAK